MGIAKKLGFALVPLLLFFALLELGARLVDPVPLPPPVQLPDRSWIPLKDRDYLLFWTMRPNPGGDGKPIINELGLRGIAPGEKDEKEFRILSLGESTTFGWRVPYEKTYSHVLEERLRSVDGRWVRVVNAGVPAYSSFQGVKYLRHRGLALEPDAVLVYFGTNDMTALTYRTIRTGSWVENQGLTDRELYALRRNPFVRTSVWLLEHSQLYRRLVVGSRVEAEELQGDPDRSRLSLQDRLDVLEEFAEICDARGIRLAIVVPIYRDFDGHQYVLRDFAAAKGVDLIDLPKRFEAAPGVRNQYFLDRVHPSPRGHRWIAGEIEAALRERWDEPKP